MKRGWINWDQAEIPPSAFQARLNRVRKTLAERELPALVVYTDVWRANQARYFSNFMPYWNRSLLVIPQKDPPILICGLSPRVYPWIRSVTILEDIRPGGNLARPLLQLCSEKRWNSIAVLDLPQLPYEISAPVCAGAVEVVDLPSHAVCEPGLDEWELSMRRHAAKLARQILAEEMAKGAGTLDYQFVGRLERAFRRAGAEDLVILLSNGKLAPRPATGAVLEESYSVAAAVEYRGHWIKLSRPHAPARVVDSMRKLFDDYLKDPKSPADTPIYVEQLSGPYPYESCDMQRVGRGTIFALHVESMTDSHRFFYGDTCCHGEFEVRPL